MIDEILSNENIIIPLFIIGLTYVLYILFRFLTNVSYRMGLLRRNYRTIGITLNEVREDFFVYSKRVTAFLVYGIIPILVIKFIFHESVEKYGFAPVHQNIKPVYFFIMAGMVLPIMYFLSRKDTIKSHYPEVKGAAISKWSLILSSITYIMYYFGYEGLYRGFLVFGLKRYTGNFFAVFMSMVFTSITHLSSPAIVLIGSVISGLIFPYIVILSGSIWALFVFHSLIGISMDILCIRSIRLEKKKEISFREDYQG